MAKGRLTTTKAFNEGDKSTAESMMPKTQIGAVLKHGLKVAMIPEHGAVVDLELVEHCPGSERFGPIKLGRKICGVCGVEF